MPKGYNTEAFAIAGSNPAPSTKIQCGIVRIRPKWGSPPTAKVDLFTYRERLRGRAEGSSTWISERHRPGRRNDSTKASCLDIQASLGALYKGRIAQLAESTHLVDSSIILGEVGGSMPPAATKHRRGRDAARRGKVVKTASVYCFTHSIYSYYWGA